MGPRSGVPDGVRARHCVILDGIVPPFLVLLWLAALLAVRRIAWPRPGGGGIAPPRWTDIVIAVLVVALGAALLSPWGVRRSTSTGPSGSGRGTSRATSRWRPLGATSLEPDACRSPAPHHRYITPAPKIHWFREPRSETMGLRPASSASQE